MESVSDLKGVPGYLARPKGASPWPAVIVIHEWWGLDGQTKSIAERFAEVGYLAFAADLYDGELAQLGDVEHASALVGKYAADGPAKLEAAFEAIKALPQCTGRVGSVGFCFGGRMSLSLALSCPLDAVCTFYGGGMHQLFDQLHALHAPVLGLFGDQDQSIPVGTVEEFDRVLDKVGVEHEIVVYPNSGHAFFRDSDPKVYKPEAARDAWRRTTAFFAAHLH